MTNPCLCGHRRPILDIITDKKVLLPTILLMGTSALSCAFVAKLFKSHVKTNALIGMSISPSYLFIHIIDHRITKSHYIQDLSEPVLIIIRVVLTIFPQLALIKIASFRGYCISYLWAPTNLLTFILSTTSIAFLYDKLSS